ncbi:hypothetical protein Lal_00032327 [Lupinus albus]|nr:hypothetical protein Lal_00032327 [Lupinus albus]
MNENLRSLNQNPAPIPSSQNLVPPGPTEYRGLDEFCKRNPSQFHGGFAPNDALEWIQGMDRIFQAMNCSVPEEWGILPDSRLSERISVLNLEIMGVSPKRGMGRLRERKAGQAVRFSLERENLAQAREPVSGTLKYCGFLAQARYSRPGESAHL